LAPILPASRRAPCSLTAAGRSTAIRCGHRKRGPRTGALAGADRTRPRKERGDFRSVAHLVRRIGQYIEYWNEDAKPFEWKATASEILGKVAILDRDYGKLVANNVK
jgi:hypothetical protein